MGGIVSSLFGGSKSKSTQESSNQAFPWLKEHLGGSVGTGTGAMSTLGSLLGIGDPAAGKTTLTNFMDSTGMNFLRDTGSKAITGNMASRGLLNSGATGKALSKFGTNLASTKLTDLMSQLTNLGQLGNQSASIIGGAGNVSSGTSSGSSSNGIFNSLFPGGLSDERLKHKLHALGRNRQGIMVYEFEFKLMPGVKHVGVLAQQAQVYVPDSVGQRDGFLTVDYSQLEPLADHPFTPPVEELA